MDTWLGSDWRKEGSETTKFLPATSLVLPCERRPGDRLSSGTAPYIREWAERPPQRYFATYLGLV